MVEGLEAAGAGCFDKCVEITLKQQSFCRTGDADCACEIVQVGVRWDLGGRFFKRKRSTEADCLMNDKPDIKPE